MDFTLWKAKYPELKDVTITFEAAGGLQHPSMCHYCKCPRNEDCSEYDTHYELDVFLTNSKPQAEEGDLYNLSLVIDQEQSTTSNKVYFEEDPNVTYWEEYFNEVFFTNKQQLQTMIRDLLLFMSEQDSTNFELETAWSLYPFPVEEE